MKKEVKNLTRFMTENGFIWGPSPEIYGGFSGFYAYAPLGKLLKGRVESQIRNFFSSNDFWEVEMPTVMQREVWKASGHLDEFNDPLASCKRCKEEFAVDKIIENELNCECPAKIDEINEMVEKNNLKCPECGGNLGKASLKSLMIKTEVGEREAYFRPETATTTYLPFKRYYHYFRRKLPFGVFQIGKAYRNEISPRQHLIRGREFVQAEAQLFLSEEQKHNFDKIDDLNKDQKVPILKDDSSDLIKVKVSKMINDILNNESYAWALIKTYNFFRSLGISEDKIRLRRHGDDEKAFYADDAWDVEINMNSFGWIEVCGVHDRTDYDLKKHSEHSHEDLNFKKDGEIIEPHIIEIAAGVDRIVYSILDLSYEKRKESEGKTTLELSPHIAPIPIAIFPLIKKDELIDVAEDIKDDLNKRFAVFYDESSNIGKRYLRANKKGIPYAVTVDFDTLEDSTVTIRDRDTEEQKRIKISEIREIVTKLVERDMTFEDIENQENK